MNLSKTLILIAAGTLSFSMLNAEAPAEKGARNEKRMERFDKNEDGQLGPREKRRAKHARKMREEFDTDGDGKLSEDEKANLKAAVEAKRAEMVKKYDTDGNGELSDAEKQAAREARRGEARQKMMEKLDTDGDGQLSESEKAAAFDAMLERRAQGGRQGKGGRAQE